MPKHMKKLLLSLVATTPLLFSLASCGESAGGDDSKDDSYEPVTIEHVFGSTTISSKPTRVATYAWGNHDMVLSLGVVPVGMSYANFGVTDEDEGVLPRAREAIEELGGEEPVIFDDLSGVNYEEIAATNPDVILAPYSALTEDAYERLSEIAPTIPQISGNRSVDRETQLRVTAKVLGLVDKGEEVIENVDKLIDKKKEEYPDFAGKKFIWANFRANDLNQVGTYNQNDTRVKSLIKMGLELPDSYLALTENETSYATKITAENSACFDDADMVIGYLSEDTRTAVKDHDIRGNYKPMKNDALPRFGNSGYLAAAGTFTPLAFNYVADEYFAKIDDALKAYKA
jgi:iron complex transport system substrate-binding protein